jgi:nicotinate-nucleotide adenylyltransferase
MVRLKIGVLGGTFDPPHLGHMLLAEFAQYALALGQVIFVPAGDPPHKDATRTSADHRLAMINLTVAGIRDWAVSRVDLDRPGPHYTVEMIQLIQEQYPGAELTFIMGSDSFRDLPTWNRPAELIRTCQLAVMERPGASFNPEMHAPLLPELSTRTTRIDAPLIGIASSDLTRWLRANAPVEKLLPPGVYSYIQKHGLYR